MWEWRLSIESNRFFQELNNKKFIRLSYQNFIDNPETSLSQIFDFLNLSFSEDLVKTISKNISRKNKNITSTDDKILQEIGGKLNTDNK